MQNAKYSKLAAAAVIYAGFAVYLYQPYFKGFNALQLRDVFVVNVSLAALGCFLLSRRWVIGFAASLFAGAIYGFGPFLLSLAKFHPSAGLFAAAVPWLFLPAAFAVKTRWKWLQVPLSALPFLAILLFFEVCFLYRLFPIPLQAKLSLSDLAGLLTASVMVDRSLALVGFYHVPIAALVMGCLMLLSARRFGVMLIFAIGVTLAFCNSIFNVSPVIWLGVAVLCCSVLVGVGIQGLVRAGFADRKWLLLTSVIMAALSIVTLLLATEYFQTFAGLGAGYAKLFVRAAQMYILGAIAVAAIFFIASANLRLAVLRAVLLCSAIGLDIFVGARFIVDKVF